MQETRERKGIEINITKGKEKGMKTEEKGRIQTQETRERKGIKHT